MARVEDSMEKLALSRLRSNIEITQLRADLRRAVRLAVQEARAERKRRGKRTSVSFIDSMPQGGNGHQNN